MQGEHFPSLRGQNHRALAPTPSWPLTRSRLGQCATQKPPAAHPPCHPDAFSSRPSTQLFTLCLSNPGSVPSCMGSFTQSSVHPGRSSATPGQGQSLRLS